MNILDIKAGSTNQASTAAGVPAPAVEQTTEPAAVITEREVLFASAAALAPAPAHHRFGHDFAVAVRNVFARHEKPADPHRHHAQRFGYLEASAMSRAMDRL